MMMNVNEMNTYSNDAVKSLNEELQTKMRLYEATHPAEFEEIELLLKESAATGKYYAYIPIINHIAKAILVKKYGYKVEYTTIADEEKYKVSW